MRRNLAGEPWRGEVVLRRFHGCEADSLLLENSKGDIVQNRTVVCMLGQPTPEQHT